MAASDAGAIFEAVVESRTELERWMDWCHPGYSGNDAKTWAASREAAFVEGEAYEFVAVAPGGRLLGVCGINCVNRSESVANLGYWVRTTAAGRGVATAAARQVVELAFRETPLQRLEIRCAVENIASQRVAEKLGALRAGILPRYFLLHGQRLDAVLFTLNRERRAA